ncbi:MAG: hypothetical protein KatS3mg085_825 [Candidatus Dojkabacteria bacterium]|nr:MAG: hypothetical protein KatS3mg085_825 [Candidatus Dojkabacteria bacterium]GIW58784.1 MAG: hypothetical protein KatS3mg086_069 [Candidatus Dojkabacteria bacterium]
MKKALVLITIIILILTNIWFYRGYVRFSVSRYSNLSKASIEYVFTIEDFTFAYSEKLEKLTIQKINKIDIDIKKQDANFLLFDWKKIETDNVYTELIPPKTCKKFVIGHEIDNLNLQGQKWSLLKCV